MATDLSSGAAERRTLVIAGEEIALSVEQDVPTEARRLIWEEFFASRSRGIDWETHFPWARAGETLCASASAGEAVVAALLVRQLPDIGTAMIGCVCVDTAFRGHGLSGQLIDLAATRLRGLGIERMLLWTGKPSVYERSGFAVAVQERRLRLRGRAARDSTSVSLSSWPGNDSMIGLPPFATAGWQAVAPAAQITFVDTPMGGALLDQTGAPKDVLNLMFTARPGDWSVTLGADHPLGQYAIAQGTCVEDAPGPVTMVRTLGDDGALPTCVPPAFRI